LLNQSESNRGVIVYAVSVCIFFHTSIFESQHLHLGAFLAKKGRADYRRWQCQIRYVSRRNSWVPRRTS